MIKFLLITIAIALVIFAIAQIIEKIWLIIPVKKDKEEVKFPFSCGFGNLNRTLSDDKQKSPSCSKEHQGKK